MTSGETRPDIGPENEPAHALTWDEVRADFEMAHNMLGETSLNSAPNVFVGQERAKTALANFIRTADDGSVALIRGRFGTGKTALANKVLYDLECEGTIDQDDYIYEFSNTSDGYVAGQKRRNPSIVVMEEVGRGATTTCLSATRQALEQGHIKRLIVNGDDTLSDPQFLEAIGVAEDKVTRIDIEPLTPSLLKEVIRSRLNFAWQYKQIERITQLYRSDIPAIITELQKLNGTEKYTQEIMDSLFDEDFLGAMAPRTEYPVAEVRASITLLSRMSQTRNYKQTARFDGETYVEHIKQQRSVELNSAEVEVLQTVSEMIGTQGKDGTFQALSAKELMMKVLGNTWQVDDFMGRIRNLLNFGYLRAFETSDLDDREDRLLSARFIPDQRVFLQAQYAPYELNPGKQFTDDFIADGETLEEKADQLLSAFLYGTVNRHTYRRIAARIVKEQMGKET